MPKAKETKKHELHKERILYIAAKSFLEVGYGASTYRGIAAAAGTTYGSIQYLWPNKEDLLSELVKYVLDGQFDAAARFLDGKTDDKLLFYAVETTMQLYMAESSESVRSLYAAAYSMPKSAAVIQSAITEKLEDIFESYLPSLNPRDFYMLEIASGGIVRSFMTVPCNTWFTMDMKVKAFLEATLRVYQIPQQKIDEVVAFVQQFDFVELAKQTIDSLYRYLEKRSSC